MNDAAPFAESLCHRCTAVKLVKGAHSTFILCTALPNKYPRQPVLQCPAFNPQSEPGRAPT